jgi:outer membrane receptor protein involved in Fe transport
VRTGWEWEHYTLTVFAKNVFNEEYVTSIERGADEATVGDERLVGVTMRGRF